MLENYEVIRKIGKGSFADVYLGKDRWNNPSSLVALKTCPIDKIPAAAHEIEILEVKKLNIYAYEY